MHESPDQIGTHAPSSRRVLRRHKAMPHRVSRPTKATPGMLVVEAGDRALLQPQPVRLATIQARIATLPATARTLMHSLDARLSLAEQVLANDPESRERFGDAETLAALLLALARTPRKAPHS